MRTSPSALVVSLALFLLGGAGIALSSSYRPAEAKVDEDRLGYLPDTSMIKVTRVGYGGFMASTLWVRGIMYFADGMFDGADTRYMGLLIRTVTLLDPNWEYPYEFGGLVLNGDKGTLTQEGAGILEAGIRQHSTNWRLRVYLAMFLKDQPNRQDSLAKILEPLTTQSTKVPDYVRTLVYGLLEKGGNERKALELLVETYGTVKDPMVRLQLRDRMGRMLQTALKEMNDPQGDFLTAMASPLADPAQRTQALQLLIQLQADSTRPQVIGTAKAVLQEYRRFKSGPSV